MSFYSTVNIHVKKSEKLKVLNIFLKNSVSYLKITSTEEEIIIKVRSLSLKQIKSLLQINNISAKYDNPKGLLSIFYRLNGRIGILIGIIMLFFCLNLSSRFVWRINIEGNTSISDEEIIKELENVGFTLGSYIPNVDYGQLHNRFLLKSKNISWISVNIDGNVANIEVREVLHENETNETKYSNVVAKYDGQIALISVINGKKQISIGDVVKKGDLLISGILDSQSEGVRYVNAQGEIKAYINKQISISIPLKSTEKIYTGNIISDESTTFFNTNINLFKKSTNFEYFYDTIEKADNVYFFGDIILPVKHKKTEYREYKNAVITIDKQEATDLAVKALNKKLEKELSNSEVLSKQIKTVFDGNSITLICDVYCIEDIAHTIEFTVNKK